MAATDRIGDDEERDDFPTLLPRCRDRFDAQVYPCYLMDNHFHLLVRLPRPQQLSR